MVRAYILITANAGRALSVVKSLRGQEGVIKVDAITGDFDLIAEVEAENVSGIGCLVVDKIQAAEGVFKTTTCLALD